MSSLNTRKRQMAMRDHYMGYSRGDSERFTQEWVQANLQKPCSHRGFARRESSYGKLPPYKVSMKTFECGQDDKCVQQNQFIDSNPLNKRRSLNSRRGVVREFDPYFMIDTYVRRNRPWGAY